jgi:hypothetical protein
MNTRSAREYTMFEPAQLLRNWREQRPINKGDLDSNVVREVGRNMVVFWVVAPCSLVEVHQRFRGSCCLHHQGDKGDRPDDGGSRDLWNVGKLVPDYTALQPRRPPSSYSPPWEPQILLRLGGSITRGLTWFWFNFRSIVRDCFGFRFKWYTL